MNPTGVIYSVVAGPIGDMFLISEGSGLTGLYLESHKGKPLGTDGWRRQDENAAFRPARDQLVAYFAGETQKFDVPLVPRGTPFQEKVWAALLDIPFGETVAYAELARRVGSQGSARAVGMAVGRNPLSIIVPCHRVVGSDGGLTGYAGGLDRKRWLLHHEGLSPGKAVFGRMNRSATN